jgi:hypothetical protein
VECSVRSTLSPRRQHAAPLRREATSTSNSNRSLDGDATPVLNAAPAATATSRAAASTDVQPQQLLHDADDQGISRLMAGYSAPAQRQKTTSTSNSNRSLDGDATSVLNAAPAATATSRAAASTDVQPQQLLHDADDQGISRLMAGYSPPAQRQKTTSTSNRSLSASIAALNASRAATATNRAAASTDVQPQQLLHDADDLDLSRLMAGYSRSKQRTGSSSHGPDRADIAPSPRGGCFERLAAAAAAGNTAEPPQGQFGGGDLTPTTSQHGMATAATAATTTTTATTKAVVNEAEAADEQMQPPTQSVQAAVDRSAGVGGQLAPTPPTTDGMAAAQATVEETATQAAGSVPPSAAAASESGRNSTQTPTATTTWTTGPRPGADVAVELQPRPAPQPKAARRAETSQPEPALSLPSGWSAVTSHATETAGRTCYINFVTVRTHHAPSLVCNGMREQILSACDEMLLELWPAWTLLSRGGHFRAFPLSPAQPKPLPSI